MGVKRLSTTMDGLARRDAYSFQAAPAIRSGDVHLRRISRRAFASLSREASLHRLISCFFYCLFHSIGNNVPAFSGVSSTPLFSPPATARDLSIPRGRPLSEHQLRRA